MSAKSDQRFMTFRNALDAEIGVAQLGVAEKGEWLKERRDYRGRRVEVVGIEFVLADTECELICN